MNGDTDERVSMLENMLDALDFAVYTFDKDRKVLYANAAAKRLIKDVSPGAATGSAEPGHFEVNQYFDEKGDLLPYPKGSAVELALKGQPTRNLVLEHRNIREHTHAWIMVSCEPVLDAKGNFEYGILWYRDISARKSREDKLKFLFESTKILSITMEFKERLQKKARLAVPSLADWCAIDILALDGSIERVALVHRDPAKIAWIADYEKKYPPPPGTESTSQRVIRTGAAELIPIVTEEMINAAPDLTEQQREDIRSLQLASIMAIPIGIPGNVLGCLTLAYAESGRTYSEEDLSFFKEFARHLSVLLENARLYGEIQQRDLAKDAFLASLSHELRNPLAPIKASVELLQLQNTDTNLKEEIDVIEHQFDHMARLLNDLLDATRFVQGKIRLEKERFDLGALVSQIAKATKSAAASAGITVSLVQDDAPLPLFADRTRIEQAITNVLGNALKFTPRGGTIRIETERTDEHALVRITDTGAGITADEMQRIFEPYYQSDRVRGGNSGLGVGLRLVHEILHLHKGSVSAASPGSEAGSVFTLTLPLAVHDSAADEPVPDTVAGGSMQVLVVDDNQAAANGLVRLFNALGCEAEAVYGADEAVDHLKTAQPDLLLLDIGMPDMDGYELIELLRTEGHTMPAVALTGYGLDEDKRKAKEAGFTAHLTKPIGVKELKEVIAAYGR